MEYFRNLRMMSKIFILILCLGMFADNGNAQPVKKPLVLAIHPFLPFNELQKRFAPLAKYLSDILKEPVIVRVGRDYKEHIDAIGRDNVDMAFLGPASYVELVKRFGKKPLLCRLELNGKPYFEGKIIIHKSSKIRSIGELKGKLFAYGDPVSTMSHLVPRYMLLKAGVKGRDLSGFEFLGSHNNVAIGVLSGDFDAGAIKEETYYKFQKQGLKILANTPKISEHVFVTRKNLPRIKIRLLKKAMLKIGSSPGGKKIMQKIKKRLTNFVPVKDSDYNNLRMILNKLKRYGIKW